MVKAATGQKVPVPNVVRTDEIRALPQNPGSGILSVEGISRQSAQRALAPLAHRHSHTWPSIYSEDAQRGLPKPA
jgi:hypothetical protein